MDKIKIAITGRVASVVALPEVVADNAEYEVDFALDPREGWDMALPITALFVRRDGSYTPRILDAGETSCTMPPQTGTNIVYVGLTQDDMRTTTPATIKVRRSIRTVANDPLPAPSEDVYAQILAAYAGIKILSGKGAPTSATQGKVNQLYRNEDTQQLYICTATGGGYTWAAVVSDTEDAVTYTAQTLTEEQKTQARANIGAGTSNFSGSYNDLNDQPNIPAATVIDTTLTKSGQAADAKAAGDAIGKKLDAPQVAQVGEVLTVEEVDAEGKPKKLKTQAMDVADVIKFTEQDLTGDQRIQARKNISVVGGKELNGLGELEVGSDTSFCVVKDYDTTSSNLGLTDDEFPMLIIKSAHIWYGRQSFYALSATGKLYSGVVSNGIQTWHEMAKRIVVNVSRTEEESGATVMSTDKTYDEINTAIENNCDVALKLDDNVFTWSQTVKNGNYNIYVFQRTDVQHRMIWSIGITRTSAGKTVVQQLTHSIPILMTNENTPPTGGVLTWIGSGYGIVSIEETLYYIPVHSILIKSSTEGSTKKFRITVDDSGTLTATELV